MTSQSVTYKVSLPYAEALLSIAQDKNGLNSSHKDMLLILDVLSKSTDLKIFLGNPLISPSLKKNVLTQLFNDQIGSDVLKFLLVLVDRRRISLLSIIIEKYLELIYQLESTTVVEISTAVVLTDSQETELTEKLKSMTNSKNIKLLFNIDTTLIGGFIAKVGSKIIDTSLSGKLKTMSAYLSSV